MDPFTAMALVSTGVQLIGQWQGNMAASDAERENEKYYRMQAMYAKDAAERQEQLSWFESSYKLSNQSSRYSGSGVDLSGSAQVTMGGTLAQAVKEVWAIREKGKMDFLLAQSRGQAAGGRADTLSSPGFNLLQAGTTAIANYGQWRSIKAHSGGEV